MYTKITQLVLTFTPVVLAVAGFIIFNYALFPSAIVMLASVAFFAVLGHLMRIWKSAIDPTNGKGQDPPSKPPKLKPKGPKPRKH